jgi:maleylpyruvate isomerase
MRPDADITGCAAAHARLLEAVSGLDDDAVRRPSLLPDWSIAHVLAHLARNADSHVNMLEGALRGEVRWQYGLDQREREIEEGAARSAAVLLDDLGSSVAELESLWQRVPDDMWATGAGRVRAGVLPVSEMPFRRWREVEIHHADLGLDRTYADFTDAYVDREEREPPDTRYSGRSF